MVDEDFTGANQMIAQRLAHPADPSLCKLLSDNRDLYMQQSAQTKNGQVAPLPARDVARERK